MKSYRILFILFVPLCLLAQGEIPAPYPGCDLSLEGFTLGGFFGIGTFSLDGDTAHLSTEMAIGYVPSWAFDAGVAAYYYPGGRWRIGIRGGINWNGISEGEKSIFGYTLWSTVYPGIVRTTGTVRLTANLGIGGGITNVNIANGVNEWKDEIPILAVYPGVGFDIPLSENLIASLEISYLWLVGEDRNIGGYFLSGSENHEDDDWAEIDYSPADFGGPTVTLGIYFGRVITLQ